MVAATKNKSRYIEPEDIVRQTHKRKGRPCAIPKDKIYLLTAGMQAGKTWRQTTNNYYQSLGLSCVSAVLDSDYEADEIFVNGKKLRYKGVLEQIGRMYAFCEKTNDYYDDLYTIVFTGIDLIRAGEKSKDIERRLRTMRINSPYIHYMSALEGR